ncbi:hypothetical protein AB0M36_24590 [Actinoplanes sp. NPDC051346]|uniref:hypothetical protein n=1 Tax=Actinoplanes sp. NPDC051346 TaxID=3155048 RepID=UPI003442678E
MTSDTLAERREYLEEGLSDIGCARCGALVRAGKRSPQQTSVQWTVRAANACAALATAHAAGRPAALVPTCPDLRDTIDRAVREGRLEVT